MYRSLVPVYLVSLQAQAISGSIVIPVRCSVPPQRTLALAYPYRKSRTAL